MVATDNIHKPDKTWSAWTDQVNLITAGVRQSFSGLEEAVLNWKPAPREWSIAQCLDHLIVTNRTYEPKFSQVLSGRTASKALSSIPGWARLWGQFIYWSVDPATSRFFPAPTLFRPADKPLPGTIVDEFCEQQEELKTWIFKLKEIDPERTFISSPISAMVIYSLKDTFRILLTHERLHLQQATRVLAAYPRR